MLVRIDAAQAGEFERKISAFARMCKKFDISFDWKKVGEQTDFVYWFTNMNGGTGAEIIHADEEERLREIRMSPYFGNLYPLPVVIYEMDEVTAKQTGDFAVAAEEKSAALAEMKQITADIKANGENYELIYHYYVRAKNFGNRHINFSDVTNAEQTVEILRSFGIYDFTFSSRWSGMIDDLAEFLEAGCQFCGITEIFSGTKSPFSDERETEKAIVLHIKH